MWTTRVRAPGARAVAPYLLVAPFFLVFGAFGVFPLVRTAWVSVHRWHLIGGDEGFRGLDNFRHLLGDPLFYNALGNTVSIFLLATVPQLALALCIATLLARRRPAWQVLVLVPNVVPVVAVALVFGQLLGRDYGIVNFLLGQVGVGPISWQAETWAAHLGVAVMVMWRWTGYTALLYLAAMRSVPRELYEAAALDGAGGWQRFRVVTLPGIRPTVLFTVVASAIGGVQMFTEPQLFDGSGLAGAGGSDRQFQTVAMYLYEVGFGRFDAGYAAAMTWVLFLFCAAFAATAVVLVRRLVSR
ncbi:cellobiose transport system permease protein [Actinokineospora baliensis]|uniref:carbohydrate ABC transporter permease n=1 Tax=Actinokineospora baliensis TaxID=547056 RepID=UPI00195D8766|nr:sugar ABC transporter permease [Actinokineospora baliensis]MBM7774835.1 cellobiose transport system permease protein [Actinokineospora baliensis]